MYWLCGPERRLVEESLDLIAHRIGAASVNDNRFFASSTPERDIWAALNQYPPPGESRFVVVREAERLRFWEMLEGWYTDPGLASCHVVFISSEPNTDTHPDHMQLIVHRGKFVRCGPFLPPAKQGEPDKRVALLRIQAKRRGATISEATCKLLIDRVRGRMDPALDFLNKCALFSGEITDQVVIALVHPAPADDFVDALIRFRVLDALMLARELGTDEASIRYLIGMADAQLDYLSRLNRALQRTSRFGNRAQRVREVIRSSRLEPFIVARLMGLARRYDPNQVRISLEALALADSRVTEGETELVLEMLVHTWAAGLAA